SGRAIVGRFDGRKLAFEEVHRFENAPIRILDSLRWDLPGIFHQVLTGISRCRDIAPNLAGIGIDTWGVDYGLLSEAGDLLDLPYAYRDRRTDGMMERALQRIPRDAIYGATGIQFMPINTLYQLLAAATGPGHVLEQAQRLLFIPDLLNYWLTGRQQSERSIASTSQLLNPRTGNWAREITDALGIPSRILPDVAPPATVLGPLDAGVMESTGIRSAAVIAPACHDTACAVAAVPATGDDWAYISSGTWSLIGVELNAPLTGPDAMAANFTNEVGVADTIRFLKNVAGLWLEQECLREWRAHGDDVSHTDLVVQARAAPPFACLIDPDDPGFAEPGDMPRRLRDYLAATGQHAPEDRGGLVRCILESLALRYRENLALIEQLTGRTINTLHVVGGGSQNELLCQLTADATRKRVIAGPVEATAIGNIMVQALACKHVGSLADVRLVVAAISELREYEPRESDAWNDAYARFQSLPAQMGS
ncbi:MAG: rhamnulokinase, partial [Phycisphaerae bacterium]|nr:rhamnulokinase [Phycisphaerae bacterium]